MQRSRRPLYQLKTTISQGELLKSEKLLGLTIPSWLVR